ncbi:MAG: PilZ domain-containing protein [Sphingomicrobium sp.]
MTGTIAPLPPSDVRSDKRTNIFLGATLRFDGRTAPVRVRDLSPNGAQIEGVALPAQEARVTLERGSVFAEGVVAWRATDRCGLRFSTPLPVAAWWPGREAPRTQADVDWTVAEIRAEIAARSAAPSDQNVGPKNGNLEPIVSPPADLATILPARVAEELACVVRMLRGIEDELSLEAVVAARHPAKLKLLGQSANLVTQLAALLQAADPTESLHIISDADLRRRLTRGVL